MTIALTMSALHNFQHRTNIHSMHKALHYHNNKFVETLKKFYLQERKKIVKN